MLDLEGKQIQMLSFFGIFREGLKMKSGWVDCLLLQRTI